jgi:glycine dehydrogenase
MTHPLRDAFVHRHIGPLGPDVDTMLKTIGTNDLDDLIAQTIPADIRCESPIVLPEALSEPEALEALSKLAQLNQVYRSYLGYGYHDCVTPPVLLRNILENPAWYTAYTPYQAEISQGRLEALLVFQTMVKDLCGMEIANASLLDEATAAAEAMTMSHRLTRGKSNRYLVAADCHPQTIAVMQTRARPLGIEVVVTDVDAFDLQTPCFGALVQYPATDGRVRDFGGLADAVHKHKGLLTVATDLLALTLLKDPAGFGADICVGNTQRFGVPMGYGGPHAAFMATREAFKRQMPGRIIGVSRDVDGIQAMRMALQTREQHIRRDRATSNICTAQVLLAIVAGMYAAWHGPEGLKRIASRVHQHTRRLAKALEKNGYTVVHAAYFDTLHIQLGDRASAVLKAAAARQINLRQNGTDAVIVALDETVSDADLVDLLAVFGCPEEEHSSTADGNDAIPANLKRDTEFMTHPTFHRYHSETEMLRYLHRLAAKDLALDTAMIPLGSCTMKLNAAAEMIPVTWRGFGGLHPFCPVDQAAGYATLFETLEQWLAEITGFSAVSLQPNAGSQGEFAGLMVIAAFHAANQDSERNICLIPTSAHGTNPASAIMAGMKVVAVKCDEQGNIDVADLKSKATEHAARLAALMVTYPSTHGVFETSIQEICSIVHQHGGQVYMDGANLNAMVGLCRPGDIGADVCHLNLHKTFCIPHGGGGPGMGPIGVAPHLSPFLPGHPINTAGGKNAIGPVSAAAWGSPSILPITWAYIRMMGGDGLTLASKIAILNANYIATRLQGHFDVLYTGVNGRVAHECILDCRPFKATSGIQAQDIAKRLVDYGFHAPTMSWPVVGTLMVEPTESESLAEIDRFCDAMIAIRAEIRAIETGASDREDNPLRRSPHTAAAVTADAWDRGYSRTQAAWPAGAGPDQHKYWPPVGRIDDVYGDRNLMCSCPPWGDDDA